MKRQISHLIILSLALALLAAGRTGAQSGEDLNVLKGSAEFSASREMLSRYLMKLALHQLEERERHIAQLSTKDEVIRRQAEVRERILSSIGGLPERTPLNPKVVGTLERDAYKIEKVIFESQPGLFVTANLYLPKTGTPPYPAILFPLGHEQGSKSHHAWQRLLITFARNGFVVLTYDPIGQGERIQNYDPDFKQWKAGSSTTEHTVIGIQCLLTGQNLARYTVWDGMRALDYLLSRKEVDSTKIGCTGNSGGGTMTAYLSALDDRIKVAAPSCYITSWRWLLKTIGPQDAEQCMPPFLLDGLDQPDFVEAFASKPYLILSAIRDFFPIAGTRESFSEAKRIYRLLGDEEKLNMVEADDGHGYTLPRRLAAYRWMSRWLKGVDASIQETEMELENEETLRCTASGQVTTSLVGETIFSLNLKHAESIKPKWEPLTNPQELQAFQKELRQNMTRLTGFRLDQSELHVRSFGELRRGGYRIEKLTYESEPDIIVPALLFVPDSGETRKPAVLYVHGRDKSADAESGGNIEHLVKAGFIVLAIDIRGTGETRVSENPETASDFYRYFGDYENAMTSLLLGKPLVGQRAQDVLRGVDLLAARAEVDPNQLLGFGKGQGAVVLLHAAMLDDRIKKLALENMLVSYHAVVKQKIHQRVFECIIPAVLRSYDLTDLVSGLAPRSVWLVNATDPLGHSLTEREVTAEYAHSIATFQMMGSARALHFLQGNTGEPFDRVYRELLNGR
jgi:cephalosporin-C deacetylase-like acetyl esterase